MTIPQKQIQASRRQEGLVHGAETMLLCWARALRRPTGALMYRRYGLNPEIERFGSHGQGLSDREFLDRTAHCQENH